MVTQEGAPSLAGRPQSFDLATLDCANSNPSLSSSPWMRGAPQCPVAESAKLSTGVIMPIVPKIGEKARSPRLAAVVLNSATCVTEAAPSDKKITPSLSVDNRERERRLMRAMSGYGTVFSEKRIFRIASRKFVAAHQLQARGNSASGLEYEARFNRHICRNGLQIGK